MTSHLFLRHPPHYPLTRLSAPAFSVTQPEQSGVGYYSQLESQDLAA